MRRCYSIEILKEETEKVLYYPKECDFRNFESITFGSLNVEAKVCKHTSNKKKISISQSLSDELLIPNIPLRLHLIEGDSTLYLGPIVGIFTAGFTSYRDVPIGNRSYYFSKLSSLYKLAGVLPIIFGIQHIQWEKGTVNGYIYHDGEWKTVNTPLPNVIYDRLPNRKIENLEIIKDLKEKLSKEYVIPWYNPGFFNKLEIYKKLMKSTHSRRYLPETIPFHHPKQLEQMLDKYDLIYIKPNNGSLGSGVYQIRKKDAQYFCLYRDEEDANRLFKFSSIKGLLHFFQKQCKNEDYIIQQGISLLKVKGKMADFRIHTNKDTKGKWRVSAIACKVSGIGSATTHLISGGSVLSLDEIFNEHSLYEEKKKKLEEASLIISRDLEAKFQEPIAEIGFDIGMDENGEIWLFEANSKPGRSIFLHPKLKHLERKIHYDILTYGVYLTEQVINKPEAFVPKGVFL